MANYSRQANRQVVRAEVELLALESVEDARAQREERDAREREEGYNLMMDYYEKYPFPVWDEDEGKWEF